MWFESRELAGFPLWQDLAQSSFVLPKVRNTGWFISQALDLREICLLSALGKRTVDRGDNPETIV